MNNQDLRRLYRFYNRKYFDGKLPEVEVRFGKTENSYGVTKHYRPGNAPRKIVIARGIHVAESLVKMTLLHEMVHVALPFQVEHGPRFEREMQRLAAAGAFRGLW